MVAELLTTDSARQRVGDLSPIQEDFKISDLDVSIDHNGLIVRTPQGLALKPDEKTVKSALQNYLGLSVSAFDEYKEDMDLCKKMIKHSITKRGAEKAFAVSNRAGQLLFMAKEDFPWILPVDAFDIAKENLPELMGAQIDGEKQITMRLVTNIAKEPPKRRGDVSHTGVWLRIGKEVETAPYVRHMVCSNGMMSDYAKTWSSVKDRYVAGVKDAIIEAHRLADPMLTNFIDLDNHTIEQPATAISQVVRRFGGGDRMVAHLVEQLPTLPEGATRYDLVDLITVQAHSMNENYEWVGGKSINYLAQHNCVHCERPL